MKAIRIHQYGGPEVLGYGEVPQPTAGKGQVLVRVQAASVNPIDYKLASGAMRGNSGDTILNYYPRLFLAPGFGSENV